MLLPPALPANRTPPFVHTHTARSKPLETRSPPFKSAPPPLVQTHTYYAPRISKVHRHPASPGHTALSHPPRVERVGLRVQHPNFRSHFGVVHTLTDKRALCVFDSLGQKSTFSQDSLVIVPSFTYDILYSKSGTTGLGIAEETLQKTDSLVSQTLSEQSAAENCVCGRSHAVGASGGSVACDVFWIACDDCDVWFYVAEDCVGFKEIGGPETWCCPKCKVAQTRERNPMLGKKDLFGDHR